MSTPVSVFPNDVSMNNRLFVGGDISANGNLAVANKATLNQVDFLGSTNFKNFVTYDSFMISRPQISLQELLHSLDQLICLEQ